MAHTAENKKLLLARLKRIQGQITAVERAIDEERECGDILLTLAATRGALNALMAEILEGHVRFHVLPEGTRSDSAHAQAAEELIEVINRYLK